MYEACLLLGNSGLNSVPVFSIIWKAIVPISVDRDDPMGRASAALKCAQRPQSDLPVSAEDWAALDGEKCEADALPQGTDKEKFRYQWKQKENRLKRGYLRRRELRAKGEVPAYPPVLIFPEGTTTGDDTLLQFKAGAFMSGQPVQPVVFKYPFCCFDPTWSADVSVLWTGWRMLSQVYNCLTVEYLPVYTPSEEEKQDPLLYGRNVRDVMAAAMGDDVVLTEHSYEGVLAA